MRGLFNCGMSDVDQLNLLYSQHEHVQIVQGGVCPDFSGHDNVVEARAVTVTDYQPIKIRSYRDTVIQTVPGLLVGSLPPVVGKYL